MDMSLSKLWELVMDREALPAAVHEVVKSWTWLSDLTELNNLIKRCSTSLIIREMQIKTTMSYRIILFRMAMIKNSTHSICWRECGVKGMLLHCWFECKLIQPLWKMVWRFLKNLGIKPPYDPATPLLGIYPEEIKTDKDTWNPFFIATLFTIARTLK